MGVGALQPDDAGKHTAVDESRGGPLRAAEGTTAPSPLVLQPGEGLTSIITYNTATGRAIAFGLTSEDEMGIIFGYTY